jgi:hypothetical protein
MRLEKYSEFRKINESQSKKIREYVDFSTFLDWYNNNRQTIADILGVEANELATEEDILTQSSALIDNIINPQSSGNRGREGTTGDIGGFTEFDDLKNHIIHDILHNIYNVSKKNFEKYEEPDFDESENIEEIEVLAIEESFMKYFKMDYVKSDFIHQNINRLVSFLLLTIIRNNPERIEMILDGEIEPYVEVYDKEYPIKDTPFENLYKVFYEIPIDPVRDNSKKIKNGQDFKDWLGYMKLYGEAMDYEDGADRASFPSWAFLGTRDFGDLDQEEMRDFMSGNYHVYPDNDFEGANTYDHEMSGLVASEYSDLPKDLSELMDSSPITEIEELTPELQKFVNDKINSWDTFKGAYEITEDEIENLNYQIIPIDARWVVSIGRRSIYFLNGDYEVIEQREGLWDDVDMDDYLIKTSTLQEQFWEVSSEYEKVIEDEINYSYHTDDLDSNVSGLNSYDDNMIAITRRYLRYNDVLVNNTKIRSKKGNFTYIKDSLFDDYISLSKKPLTDNAKKLIEVFDTFRGWAIKNIDTLKKRGKKMKKLFTSDDMLLLKDYNKDLEKFKELIYENETLEKLSENKGSVILSISDIKFNFSKNYQVPQTIERYRRYKELFKNIDSEHVINYLKRVPNVNPDKLKEDINRFNDMFTDRLLNTYDKYKDYFKSLSEHSDSDIESDIESAFPDDKRSYFSSFINNHNIEEKDFGKLLDAFESTVKNHIKDAKLVRNNLSPIIKNGIIHKIEKKGDPKSPFKWIMDFFEFDFIFNLPS